MSKSISPHLRFELTRTLRTRLPRELRDMIYDAVLTGDALEDMRKPMHSMTLSPPTYPFSRAMYAQGPRFLVPGLVDRDIIHEIIFHYYKTGKYPALALPKHCNTFLQHDFYGAGIVGADIALPHLEILYGKRSESLAPFGFPRPTNDTFRSLFDHEHIWNHPGCFTFHLSVDCLSGTSTRLLDQICVSHKCLEGLLRQIEARGAKTSFAMVTTAQDGSIIRTDLQEHIDVLNAGRRCSEPGAAEKAREVMMQLQINPWTRRKRACCVHPGAGGENLGRFAVQLTKGWSEGSATELVQT